jgi:pyruvate formate lyase activating enzyme
MPVVTCELCPHACRLEHGQAGKCRVRVNLDGRLLATTFGYPVSLHVDPMEKKPLFHFLPGEPVFSLATVGCNLSCVHCQNWEISQANPEDAEAYEMPPLQVASLAQKKGCRAVAYTYTEPIVYYEYAYDCSVACRERGIRNVLVSAGFVNPKPWRKLCKVVDGAILDLKSMSEQHYREICGGSLGPVLDAMRIAKEEGLWVEILVLLVPTLNDSDANVDEAVAFVRDELGADTPLHFTAFHPEYRLQNLPRTPQETLDRARKRALDAGLHYVYVGNVSRVTEGESTFCPGCGTLLIEREGYEIMRNLLSGARALDAHARACPSCGTAIAGVWA